jgi:hypothetical protein
MAGYEFVPDEPVTAPQAGPVAPKQYTFMPGGIPYIDPRLSLPGADAAVRFAVGAATTPDDRLSTLRKFHPEAQPYGDDNFVVQKGGQWMLMNPAGLDRRDFAGAAPEISEAVVGTLGGAAGTMVGGPGMGTAAGFGAGAIAGKELAEQTGKLLFGTDDTRSIGRHIVDDAVTGVINAGGSLAGDALVAGGKKLIGPMITGAGLGRGAPVAQDFADLGVQPSASQATGNSRTAALEQFANVTFAGSGTLQRFYENQLGKVAQVTKDITAKFGTELTPEGAGATIRSASESALTRGKNAVSAAYEKAYGLVGRNTPVDVSAIKMLRDQFETTMSTAPESLAGTYEPAIKQVDKLLKDAERQGGVSFEAVRRVRTILGQNLDDPIAGGGSGSAVNDLLRGYYGKLTSVLDDTAARVSPEAKKAIDEANTTAKTWNAERGPRELLNRIKDEKTDEAVYKLALGGGKSGDQIKMLRDQFKPEEWDDVAATALGRMGLAKPGVQDAAGEVFSPSTFLTNWNSMSKEAREAIFGGTRYKAVSAELDKLVNVLGSIKGAEKMASNPSGTGRMVVMNDLFRSVGLAGGFLLGTGSTTAAGGALAAAGGTQVGSYATAKLLTNPGVVRWLTNTATSISKASSDVGAMEALTTAVGRLPGIVAIDKSVGPYVSDLANAIYGSMHSTANEVLDSKTRKQAN